MPDHPHSASAGAPPVAASVGPEGPAAAAPAAPPDAGGAPPHESPPAFPAVSIDGTRIHDLSEAEAVEAVAAGAAWSHAAGRGLNVVTPNLDHLYLLRHDRAFREVYEAAYLRLCDGKPLLLLARRLGTPLRHGVVAGSQFFVTLCAAAPARGWRIFLLGGAPGRAEEARAILEARHPGIEFAGSWCPPPGFERSAEEWEKMRAALAAAAGAGALDLVFLALGSPKSEKTAARLVAEGAPPAVYLNVGAAYDFVCGKPKRAPRVVRALALEWAWRLAHDPRRLFRRYILHDLPLFVRLMLRPRA